MTGDNSKVLPNYGSDPGEGILITGHGVIKITKEVADAIDKDAKDNPYLCPECLKQGKISVLIKQGGCVQCMNCDYGKCDI